MATGPSVETRTLVYPRDLCDPKDWLNFVQLDPFENAWKRIGLGDEDLRALEIIIMVDPKRWPLIRGTGGVRKLRFSPGSWNQGSSGALRVCYAYFESFGLVALIHAYTKTQKDDLTPTERKVIKKLIEEVEGYLASRRREAT